MEGRYECVATERDVPVGNLCPHAASEMEPDAFCNLLVHLSTSWVHWMVVEGLSYWAGKTAFVIQAAQWLLAGHKYPTGGE